MKHCDRPVVPFALFISAAVFSLCPGIVEVGWADIPAAFVDIGYGARPVAMGEAFVALADDANAVVWNPAGLVLLTRREATFMYARQFGLIPYYFVAYGQGLFRNHGVGGAAIYSGDDALSETTFLLSYAYSWRDRLIPPFSGLSTGVNVKVRVARFGNNPDGGENRVTGDALGFGADLGVQWRINGSFSYGILIRDLFAPVTWHSSVRGEYGESVPPALVSGVAIRIRDGTALTLDLNKALADDTNDRVHLGGETTLFRIVTLRAGFSQDTAPEPNRKYVLGLGLNYGYDDRLFFSLDMAYQFHWLANTPRISTSFRF